MERHPELAGQRFREPGLPQVYLVDTDGRKRWIPNLETYDHLFADGNITEDIGTADIEEGHPMPNGAILASTGDGNTYLTDLSYDVFDNRSLVKRAISPDAMSKFDFAASQVQTLPHILLDFIPVGPAVS